MSVVPCGFLRAADRPTVESDDELTFTIVIDPADLRATMADLGEPAYRAAQVYQALTRGLVTDFEAVGVLPRALRAALADRLDAVTLTPVESYVTAHGDARKTLFATRDGQPVEAVLMLYRTRATVCVSSQVGCAVGCAFCASGSEGLIRDLTAEEMVDQVLHFARELRRSGRSVTNVVVMGMGEPFHNYDETLRACRLLHDPDGFGLGARGLSISTAGVVPMIRRFTAEASQINLAVSLHAATDELRDQLVPLNRRFPLDELLRACAEYVAARRRKLLFEYVVLAGVNDGDDQVKALAARLGRRSLYHLNLIAYNETGEFARPRARELAALRDRLEAAGVACTLRRSPGGEIEAACGQLALGRHGGRERGSVGRTD
ncbi:MAG TPA: 23S rRNA (adenine(2503)-C(2))-methyltransferase RlmN [Thermoleophilia bacterium]|nr:23S rRNA (adenine(2503)-C(2))-methyltransferase RlmN [Thermoleophilia bacterium]